MLRRLSADLDGDEEVDDNEIPLCSMAWLNEVSGSSSNSTCCRKGGGASVLGSPPVVVEMGSPFIIPSKMRSKFREKRSSSEEGFWRGLR